MFTLHVYDLTKGGGYDGGVTEEKAAEPVILDRCWVSTFVSVKLLDISDERPWHHWIL